MDEEPAYRHVAWGGSGEDPLTVRDMGPPPVTTDQNLTDLVVAFLKEKHKYLEQIAPESISPSAVALEDGYVLIRPALADEKIEAERARAAGGTPIGAVAGGGAQPGIAQPDVGSGAAAPGLGGSPIPPGGGPTPDGKPRRVHLDVEVPFTDFHTFYTGILNALGRNADHIRIRVELEASSESGFSPTLIEDTVKETLFNLFRTDEDLRVDE